MADRTATRKKIYKERETKKKYWSDSPGTYTSMRYVFYWYDVVFFFFFLIYFKILILINNDAWRVLLG